MAKGLPEGVHYAQINAQLLIKHAVDDETVNFCKEILNTHTLLLLTLLTAPEKQLTRFSVSNIVKRALIGQPPEPC